jgi:hypothetical protein
LSGSLSLFANLPDTILRCGPSSPGRHADDVERMQERVVLSRHDRYKVKSSHGVSPKTLETVFFEREGSCSERGLEPPDGGLEAVAGVDNQVAARRQFGYRNEVALVAGINLLRSI